MTRPKVLNHRASKTAEQLFYLFQNAYRQEAKAIGGASLGYFSLLQRDAAAIRLAPSRVMGIESVGGEIVAAIELIEPSSTQAWCLIDGLCVCPNAQRRGHAAALLKAVIELYGKRGVALRVKTAQANKPALALYDQFNFVVIGQESRHGIDLVILELAP